MPELPEVETCRRIVERELMGRRVDRVTVRLAKLLRFSPMPDVANLVGHRVIAARRRAKILTIDFDGALSLMMHLKLAGQIALHRPDGSRHTAGHPVPDPAGFYPHKTTHVEFAFDEGSILYVSDIRQFGWFRLMPTADVEPTLATFKLGPEATGADGMDAALLAPRLSRRSIPIKLALLDQTVIAGIGNIYVDEALHRARLHPQRPANSLNQTEIDQLWSAIHWAMEQGVAQGGAKIIHGKAYPINGFPAVHARKDLPCPNCGAPIAKIRVGTRGTYLCPNCQPTA